MTHPHLFWNIQNAYDYKLTMPQELEMEGEIKGDSELALRVMARKSQRLYQKKKLNYRATVVEIMADAEADLIGIVEFCVGKTEIYKQGIKVQEYVTNEHFGVGQLMISLNDRLKSHKMFYCAFSPLNTTDIVAYLEESGRISTIVSKNTMFEMYGLLYNSSIFNAVNSQGAYTSRMELINEKPFPGRFPGCIYLDSKTTEAQITYIINHSIYGGTRKTDINKRKNTLHLLSQVIESLTTDHNGRKNELKIAIAGDFNLDWTEYETLYKVLSDSGMDTACIGDKKTSRVYGSVTDLHHAYDQIFIRNLSLGAPKNFTGQAIDFADCYFEGNYGKAKYISDHLPVTSIIEF